MQLNEGTGTAYDLAVHRLSIARQDLETALLTYKEQHFRAANNRAYYAIYHGITAVLALDKVAFKRHKDTIAYFNKEYVKTEIFSRQLGKRISQAEEVRHASDYDEFYLVSKEETETQIETARMLLTLVEAYLEEKK